VWADPVWALELALPDPVVPAASPVHHPLPLYPAVERDLALLVADTVTAASVMALMRERGGELLEEVTLFDHYRGEGVPVGQRSVAFRLRFRAAERTLKDKEVDRAVQAIVGRLKEELGVEPRG
jgi:phenylalanyl-tRNA synthetase beta chain